ncbi:MAG: ankyrin repeat domain-containing protein [Hyphomonadaceae bacterium]|nr:ankyrin repeat domain-containing protein [Hyphomonadaceae bacterium]
MPGLQCLLLSLLVATAGLVGAGAPVSAQTPPTAEEIAAYTDLHAAAVGGSTAEIERLVQNGADINQRDGFGRTPLMVAAYRRDIAVARVLIELGANMNALEHQSYDVITIAAVQNDLEMLKLALASGGNARAITSPYGGTALIAAAHLGHAEVVEALIQARAPLDHVNNLGWTALIEAIVLGDGGSRHQATLAALIKAGADVNLPDRNGATPLALARGRGATAMVQMLEAAGAKS